MAFALACVWTIATARAQTGGAQVEHAGFVVDAPGLVDGRLTVASPHWALARDAMMTDPLHLESVSPPTLFRHEADRLHLWLGPRHEPDRVGIGRTIHLSGHRELVLDLTPSPRHCAPLVAVSF